jgi:hypothetical protein
MARKLGRPDQQAQEEDPCEDDDEEPLQSDATLSGVLESGVRAV